MHLPLVTIFVSATLTLAASEAPSSSSVASAAASSSHVNNSMLSPDKSNVGTCDGPLGSNASTFVIGSSWPGVLGKNEISCNSGYNNVTRQCCAELGGEAKMGSCGLIACRLANTTTTNPSAFKCFEKYGGRMGTCSGPNSAAMQTTVGLAVMLLASSIALGMTL